MQRFARKVPGATLLVRRGPHNDIPGPELQFDRLVISGSGTSCLAEAPWISNLDELIRRTLDAGKPILGVCYGHQSVIRAMAGRQALRRAKAPEFGWTQIQITDPSPLLNGLPKKFCSFSSHYEEVIELPKGLRKLAESDLCAIQAYQLEDRPVFGIQFHPEKDLIDAEKIFKSRRAQGEGHILMHPEKSEKLYDPAIGDTIFKNFFSA